VRNERPDIARTDISLIIHSIKDKMIALHRRDDATPLTDHEPDTLPQAAATEQ
jgi:hypothetical protein